MKRRTRSAVGIAIVVLFALSVAFAFRYPWVIRAWYIGLFLFVVALSVSYVRDIVRHGDRPTTLYGQPRWLTKFLFDEDDKAPQARQKRHKSDD